jgi:oxygen-dependent protoporphyrinogen oxidase
VRNERAAALGEKALVALARRELKLAINLQAEPAFARVHRWPKATPQYNLGHCELIEHIEAEARRLPGLTISGSACHGLGVPDCVREGANAAARVIPQQ